MNRGLLFLFAATAACTQVPDHNGYKTNTTHPWTKFKTLKFDDKGEAKSDGSLSYPDRKRAAWFGVDLTKPSSLSIKLDISPGDSVPNQDDFDLGLEILDPGNHPLVRKDLDEGDSQHDLGKTAEVKDLPPGHYLIHLYLQGRLDTADYTLKAKLSDGNATAAPTNFPADVAFAPPLPAVPITDDAPHRPPPPPHGHYHPHEPPPPPPPVVKATTRAPIIAVSQAGGGTTITIAISGAHDGQTGSLAGLPSATFSLKNCNDRTCQATLERATPDQISHAGAVTIDQ